MHAPLRSREFEERRRNADEENETETVCLCSVQAQAFELQWNKEKIRFSFCHSGFPKPFLLRTVTELKLLFSCVTRQNTLRRKKKKNEKKEEEEEEGGAKLLEEQTEKNFYMKFKTQTRNIPCIQHAVTGSLCTISSVTVHSERYVRLCQ